MIYRVRRTGQIFENNDARDTAARAMLAALEAASDWIARHDGRKEEMPIVKNARAAIKLAEAAGITAEG